MRKLRLLKKKLLNSRKSLLRKPIVLRPQNKKGFYSAFSLKSETSATNVAVRNSEKSSNPLQAITDISKAVDKANIREHPTNYSHLTIIDLNIF